MEVVSSQKCLLSSNVLVEACVRYLEVMTVDRWIDGAASMYKGDESMMKVRISIGYGPKSGHIHFSTAGPACSSAPP